MANPLHLIIMTIFMILQLEKKRKKRMSFSNSEFYKSALANCYVMSYYNDELEVLGNLLLSHELFFFNMREMLYVGVTTDEDAHGSVLLL